MGAGAAEDRSLVHRLQRASTTRRTRAPDPERVRPIRSAADVRSGPFLVQNRLQTGPSSGEHLPDAPPCCQRAGDAREPTVRILHGRPYPGRLLPQPPDQLHKSLTARTFHLDRKPGSAGLPSSHCPISLAIGLCPPTRAAFRYHARVVSPRVPCAEPPSPSSPSYSPAARRSGRMRSTSATVRRIPRATTRQPRRPRDSLTALTSSQSSSVAAWCATAATTHPVS